MVLFVLQRLIAFNSNLMTHQNDKLPQRWHRSNVSN